MQKRSQSVLHEHPLLTQHNGSGIEPLFDVDPGVSVAMHRVPSISGLEWRQIVGGLLIVAGLVAVAAGWWGVGGTRDTTHQLAYLVSGGAGGAILVLLGAVFLSAYEHSADRAVLADVEARLGSVERALTTVGTAPQPVTD